MADETKSAFPPPESVPHTVNWQTTNSFAIASLVSGVVWLSGIGSILALVFGYMAKRQIAASNGRQGGGGMATAGIILGWVGIGVTIGFFIILLLAVSALNHMD
jgi:hypothetical protein